MYQLILSLEELLKEFITVRKNTINLFKPLQIEDAVIQSSDFGSPPNWHIAHVTWFFQNLAKYYQKLKEVDSPVQLLKRL
jgi:hypothetical protein